MATREDGRSEDWRPKGYGEDHLQDSGISTVNWTTFGLERNHRSPHSRQQSTDDDDDDDDNVVILNNKSSL